MELFVFMPIYFMPKSCCCSRFNSSCPCILFCIYFLFYFAPVLVIFVCFKVLHIYSCHKLFVLFLCEWKIDLLHYIPLWKQSRLSQNLKFKLGFFVFVGFNIIRIKKVLFATYVSFCIIRDLWSRTDCWLLLKFSLCRCMASRGLCWQGS